MNSVKTVIFLGAGASASEGAPLQKDIFGEYFKSIRRRLGHGNIEYELRTFFDLMFGINVDDGDLEKMAFPAFEEALGIIDLAELRKESLKDFDLESVACNSGRIRFFRQYLIQIMATVIAEKLQGPQRLHKRLIQNLSDNNLLSRTAFISTNYDILIDNALSSFYEQDPGKSINYGVEFINFKMSNDWSHPRADAIYLLKLHGSLNWLLCRTCSSLKITPFKKGAAYIANDPASATCEHCESLMTAFIIPPSFYKEMSNVFVSIVWNKAETVIRQAERVIFCGYSFPDADMHIKYILKRAETNRAIRPPLEFIVINNHEGKKTEQSEAERIRYERFLRGKVNFTDKSFEDFVNAPQVFYKNGI